MAEPKMSGTIPPPRDGLMGAWDRFGSAALLELSPVEKRRSVASGLYTMWLAGTSIVAPPPSGHAWRPSVLGFKLLLGHGTPRGPLSALRRRRRPVGG